MEFSSSSVLAYILYMGKQENIDINKTKAQKLLYCCYGIIMAKFDKRLTDEHPRAWMYGPVFPRTFNDIEKHRLTVGMALDFEKECPPEWLEFIKLTLRTFWVYSASILSGWSHRKDSPWYKAEPLAALDDREIRLYFEPLVKVVMTRGKECRTATPT